MGSARPTPKIVYYPLVFTITSATNDRIDVQETSGVNLAASLTAGEYTLAGMAAEVKRALDAAGASTYTVTYNLSGTYQNKLTITSDGIGGGGLLKLMGATGPNVSRSALPTLSYTATDHTGALTYNSDAVAPAAVTLTFDEDIRKPVPSKAPDASVTDASSGVRQTLTRHIANTYKFSNVYVSESSMESWETFLDQCGCRGGQFDFYPKSGTSTWVNFTLNDRRVEYPEMIEQNLFQRYAFVLVLREVLPSETVNTPGGRGSRMKTLLNRSQWLS